MKIDCVDKEDSFVKKEFQLQTEFSSRFACSEYVNKLPSLLLAKGFVTASVDSVLYDSAFAKIILYLGRQYRWASINTKSVEPPFLQVTGWNEKLFSGNSLDFAQLETKKEKMLDYLENSGYPFGKIYLDSLQLIDDSVFALLKVEKGPLYKVDSIRVFGDAKISKSFLQHYIGIPNGSIYSKKKISDVSRKIAELVFLQEEQAANLSKLGTGSVLNLYLKSKKSSQINMLMGFLPNSDQSSSKKFLITGEANINLKNAFGSGETFGLSWQQLQLKSPRLNILYQHPFVFNSSAGLDLSFDMFRKDSSFLNINMNVGARYFLSDAQAGALFIRSSQTILNEGGIKDEQIMATRKLPDIADMNVVSFGLEFEKNKTNYRYNPRSGYEFKVSGFAGSKKIKKNNQILELKDINDPGFDFENLYDTVKLKSYQLTFQGNFSKYFNVGKQGTIKAGVKAGIFQSERIFRNELFQIGGYKTLRGFDEESEYVSRFAITTFEYRYLIGMNSYFFGFIDGGFAGNQSVATSINHSYLGSGLGIAFETKAGILNLAWAIGKRDDSNINLKQSKIHFGFVNYF